MTDKILVLNGPSYANAVDGIGEVVNDLNIFLTKPSDFKCILFTGGEDVNPELYDDFSPKNVCGFNPHRDKVEANIFKLAKKYEIPMAGICRGMQFLNVMAGGKLIHHLDNHTGTSHLMSTPIQEDPILVNSLHHQAAIPPLEATVIGWSTKNLSERYIGYMDKHFDYPGKEVEAIVVPKDNIFAVQYHPEMMDENSNGYIFFNAGLMMFLDMGPEQFLKEFKYEGYNGSANATQ